MSELGSEELGALVQAYTRAKWGSEGDPSGADRLGARLDRQLRDRVDVLGVDGERLLTVRPADVLATLEALEREAFREDAGAEAAAIRLRIQEPGRLAQPTPQPRGRRPRPGKRREPTPSGRRRQRGER
jgi:hypothetical protein